MLDERARTQTLFLSRFLCKLFTKTQQNKQQKDPGSGPGVPALPETDTLTPSPSAFEQSPDVSPSFNDFFAFGAHNAAAD
ncbi:hypothetical protein ACLKA7_002022 [Drosophila subpalustris]